MIRKLTTLGIAFIMLFAVIGLTACTDSKRESMKTVEFELGSKATDYFETGDREQLLQIIRSTDDLIRLSEEKQFSVSPVYGDVFFEEHTLILYFFMANIYNDLKITVKTEGDTLFIYKTFDLPNGTGTTAERPWTFMIEVKTTDTTEITQIELK